MKYVILFVMFLIPSVCFADLQADLDAANIKVLRTQLELIKTQEAVAQQQREKEVALSEIEDLRLQLSGTNEQEKISPVNMEMSCGTTISCDTTVK